jgi:hypothetical protein
VDAVAGMRGVLRDWLAGAGPEALSRRATMAGSGRTS